MVAPCAILGLLRQEEFSFAAASALATFGVSVCAFLVDTAVELDLDAEALWCPIEVLGT